VQPPCAAALGDNRAIKKYTRVSCCSSSQSSQGGCTFSIRAIIADVLWSEATGGASAPSAASCAAERSGQGAVEQASRHGGLGKHILSILFTLSLLPRMLHPLNPFQHRVYRPRMWSVMVQDKPLHHHALLRALTKELQCEPADISHFELNICVTLSSESIPGVTPHWLCIGWSWHPTGLIHICRRSHCRRRTILRC